MESIYQRVKKKIDKNELVILDGGVGTELQFRGIEMDETWCGSASLNTQVLEQVHLDYINAGAEIITTNTYASSRLMLEAGGLGENFEEINLKAIYAAQEAKRKTKRDDILIAGSLSHRLPIPDGAKQSDPKHRVSESRLKENCEEMAMFLADNGCDVIILEMMYHPDRMQSVFEAAAKSRKPVWAGFSTRLSDTGLVLSFMEEDDIPFENIASIVKDFNIDVAGIMHTDVNAVSESLKVLKTFFDGPLMVYPDSGGWVSPNWDFDRVIQPKQFRSFAEKWRDEGVNIIGGCCGLSPNHIKEITQLKL